jgi:hypothetical protein
MMPCKLTPPLDEPRIMNIVAVISSTKPRLRNTNTNNETDLVRCSLMIPIVYDSNAKKTMMVPVRTREFIGYFQF